MKNGFLKITILAAAVSAVAVSCHKVPSTIDRDGEYLVYTAGDETTDFTKFTTYNIPDSILVVGESPRPQYSRGSFAQDIVAQYKTCMEKAGYVYADRESADIGIQVTYVVDTDNYVYYVSDPYWWMDYPGYWWPSSYWGGWYGWSYAHPVSYSFSTNTLMTEMMDLTSASEEDESLQVIWSSFINGAQGSNLYNDKLKLEKAVAQSFSQSSYIGKNK